MMFKAYVWIDGEEFNPREFQQKLPENLRGTVETRKRMANGVAVEDTNYWKSDVITADNFLPESSLEDLLTRYSDAMAHARRLNATRVFLEVVNEYDENQGAQGVFLHEELVQLLAKIGAAIDFDIVRCTI